MAYFAGSMYSKALDMETHLEIVLPYDKPAQNQQEPCQVVFLLHGISNDSSSWMRMSAVERYARARGMALVIPEVQRSFYANMDRGLRYFDYVAEELPRFCRENFRISPRREDTFVAGLSMGGYGAVKVCLSKPETFAACASFSGALDLAGLKASVGAAAGQPQMAEMEGVFGEGLPLAQENDLFFLLEQAAKLPQERRPRLFVTCGQQDPLYEQNQNFRRAAEQLPITFRYEEWPGVHDWDFWDPSVEKALAFFAQETE